MTAGFKEINAYFSPPPRASPASAIKMSLVLRNSSLHFLAGLV